MLLCALCLWENDMRRRKEPTTNKRRPFLFFPSIPRRGTKNISNKFPHMQKKIPVNGIIHLELLFSFIIYQGVSYAVVNPSQKMPFQTRNYRRMTIDDDDPINLQREFIIWSHRTIRINDFFTQISAFTNFSTKYWKNM